MTHYMDTDFGKIPLPDEHIPRKEWAQYKRAAVAYAQKEWVEGRTSAEPLSMADARGMPEFQKIRVVTSGGYIDHDTNKPWED